MFIILYYEIALLVMIRYMYFYTSISTDALCFCTYIHFISLTTSTWLNESSNSIKCLHISITHMVEKISVCYYLGNYLYVFGLIKFSTLSGFFVGIWFQAEIIVYVFVQLHSVTCCVGDSDVMFDPYVRSRPFRSFTFNSTNYHLVYSYRIHHLYWQSNSTCIRELLVRIVWPVHKPVFSTSTTCISCNL